MTRSAKRSALLLPFLLLGAGACGSSSKSDDDKIVCEGKIYQGTLSVDNKTEMARMEGITCLQGSLVLSSRGCRGQPKALPDLNVLKDLEVIEGDVVLQGATGELSALKNLRRVGRLQVCNSDAVSISFPHLAQGDVLVQGSQALDLPALKTSRLVSVQSDSLKELDLPALATTGRVVVSASPAFERLSVPQLQSVASLELSALPRLESVLADKLTEVSSLSIKNVSADRDRPLTLDFLSALTTVSGTLEFEDCANLKTIDLDQLKTLEGRLSLRNLKTLESVSVSSLEKAESVDIAQVPVLRTLELNPVSGTLHDFSIVDAPVLSGTLEAAANTIRGRLQVQNTRLSALHLESVQSIRRALIIENNPQLVDVKMPKLESIAGKITVKDNSRLPVASATALAKEGPRFTQCGQKGGAPCSFAPPRKRYEALPSTVEFVRNRKLRAYASSRADTAAALSVLQYLGEREKKIAKKTPTIFLRSQVSDAVVVVRGKKGAGAVTEWLWLRKVPGRGYTTLARGKPKRGEKLQKVRAFVDFDEAYLVGEISRRGKKVPTKMAVYRLNRRTKPASSRIGSLDINRAASVDVLKRGLSSARVGIRDGDIEVSFHQSKDRGLPLVFRRPHRGKANFAIDETLGTALKPGETRADVVLQTDSAAASTPLPILSRQAPADATHEVGNGCRSVVPVPTCPSGTKPAAAGPPTSSKFECRRDNGVLHGPSIQWYRHRCSEKGEHLIVRARGKIDNGRRTGVWEFYRADGGVREQATYADGLKIGQSRLYTADGDVEAEGTLDGGNRVGTWKVRSRGKLRRRTY